MRSLNVPQSEHVLCCHDTRLTTPIRYDRGNRSSAGALLLSKVESPMQWQKWIVRLRAAGFGDTTEVSNLLRGSGRSRGEKIVRNREGKRSTSEKWNPTGSDVRRIPRVHLCKAKHRSVSVTEFNVFPRHYLFVTISRFPRVWELPRYDKVISRIKITSPPVTQFTNVVAFTAAIIILKWDKWIEYVILTFENSYHQFRRFFSKKKAFFKERNTSRLYIYSTVY